MTNAILTSHWIIQLAIEAGGVTDEDVAVDRNSSIGELLIRVSGEMFVLALKIAAPIVIALFLSNLCLGIVARTVPQVNILMIGFPINITIGLVFFSLVISAFLQKKTNN